MVACSSSIGVALSCSTGFRMQDVKVLADGKSDEQDVEAAPSHPAIVQYLDRLVLLRAARGYRHHN